MKRKAKTSGVTVHGRAVEMVALADLKPYAKNAMMHPVDQIEALQAVIRDSGFTAPLVIDPENEIIAGHGRLEAARRLGMPEVPCVRVSGLNAAQIKALRLSDNALGRRGEWDFKLALGELSELQSLKFDLSLAGFSDLDLGKIGVEGYGLDERLEQAEETPEPPKDPIVQRGELWLLGGHRILVGDCRDAKDVARLVGDAKINVAFTSPPYAEQRDYDATSGFKPIAPHDYVEWFKAVAANVATHLAKDGSWFVNIKPSCEGLDTSLYVHDLVAAHVRKWRWHFATEFCWERSGMPGKVHRRFKNQFEPVYQFALNGWKFRPKAVTHKSDNVPFYIAGTRASASLDREQGTGALDFRNAKSAGAAYPGNRLPKFMSEANGHNAAFPVGLPEFFIRAFSDASDVMYDPFMGSGSTLIAAETTKCLALGMEISPAYGEVIIRRFEKFTGKTATREDGATLESLAKAKKRKAA